MKRRTLEAHLAQAEAAVALGQQHIAKQHDLIERLERDGHDTTTAKAVLETFLGTQQAHEAHRQTLLNELQRSEKKPTLRPVK